MDSSSGSRTSHGSPRSRGALFVLPVLVAAAICGLVWIKGRIRLGRGDLRVPEKTQTHGSGPPSSTGLDAKDFPSPIDLGCVDRDRDLHGHVRSKRGLAVPGADVMVFRRLPGGLGFADLDSPELSAGPACQSSIDGSFSLRLSPAESVVLTVRKAGFAPCAVSQCRAGERLDVVLDENAILAVFAVLADGRPAAGAQVVADGFCFGENGTHRACGVTDAAGLCRLDTIPLGVPGRIRALSSDGTESAMVDLVVDAGPGPVVLHLRANPVYHGIVTSAHDNAPISGARVSPKRFPGSKTTTDLRGEFSIQLPALDELQFCADGFADLVDSARELSFGAVPVFSMSRAIALVGRLVDDKGNPVGDGQLALFESEDFLFWSDPHIRGEITPSAQDGRFRIPDARLNTDCLLRAYSPTAGVWTRALKISTEAEADLGDLRLSRGTRISGRVLNADGTPVRRCSVLLDSASISDAKDVLDLIKPAYRLRTKTDDLGRYAFEHLDPGEWELRANPDPPLLWDIRRAVVSGSDFNSFDLHLPDVPPGQACVALSDGSPVAGVLLNIEPISQWVRTDLQGKAVFALPCHSRIRPQPTVEFCFEPEEGNVHPGMGVVRFVATPRRQIAGVALRATGEPLEAATVRARRGDNVLDTTHTDDQGRFLIRLNSDAACVLEVVGEGQPSEVWYGSIEFRAASEACEARIPAVRREADEILRLRTVGPSGQPVEAEVVVSGWADSGEYSNIKSTDASGAVAFGPLCHTAIRVTVRGGICKETGERFVDRDGLWLFPAGQEIVLTLQPAVRIEGDVILPPGMDDLPADVSVYRGETCIEHYVYVEGEHFSCTIDRALLVGARVVASAHKGRTFFLGSCEVPLANPIGLRVELKPISR